MDDEKALIILVTAFEMIFLKKERYKKEKLAKRSAVYFGDSDAEIFQIYQKIKLCYSERSNYVHEGKSIQDSENRLRFLRNLLRKFILDNKDTNIMKSVLIKQLKLKVDELQHLFPNT